MAGCRAREEKQYRVVPFKKGEVTRRGLGVTSQWGRSQLSAHRGRHMKQCVKCREVLYCCRPCQVENWIIHGEGCIAASCTAVNIVPTIVKEKKKWQRLRSWLRRTWLIVASNVNRFRVLNNDNRWGRWKMKGERNTQTWDNETLFKFWFKTDTVDTVATDKENM